MKSIRTILACVRKADQTYNLINHGDKIVVGISGGKDSIALLYALHLYQKFSHTDFTLQPVTLDLGFPGFDPRPIKNFCESLGYELIINDSKEVYKILQLNQKDHSHLPCSICSKMKKAAINKVANTLNYNKVAFAHHCDDAIETLFLNEIYGGRFATFSPKMLLERAGVTFIRPFILVRESEIVKLIKEENLPICPSHCPADKLTTRESIKNILKNIYKEFPESKETFLTMLTNYEKEDTWGKQIEYQVNQCGLTMSPVVTQNQYIECLKVREAVFVKEQHIDPILEMELERETNCYPFLIKYNGVPIGTIRYRLTDEGIRFERFCILKEYRNKHFGKEAFQFLTNYIRDRFNPCRIYFHAMYYLKDFYTSLGYKTKGSIFMEANIEHIEMEMHCK